MGLKFYSGHTGGNEIAESQVFTGNGVDTNFPLTAMTGANLGSVYRETFLTQAGVTFAAGVGSGFVGLGVNTLKGHRLIHNGKFRGLVTANDATTVTIDDASYAATAFTAVVSTFGSGPLRLIDDYSVSGNTLIAVAAPAATQRLHAIPKLPLSQIFGAAAGASVTKEVAIRIERDDPAFIYDSLLVASEDRSMSQSTLTQAGVTFASGVGSGFSGLTVNGLIGRAVLHDGVFRGLVTANDATTVTIDDLAYTQASAKDAVVFTVGPLLIAPDSGGVAGTYKAVYHPAAITDNTPVKLWIKQTMKIPETAQNYPGLNLYVSGQEAVAP